MKKEIGEIFGKFADSLFSVSQKDNINAYCHKCGEETTHKLLNKKITDNKSRIIESELYECLYCLTKIYITKNINNHEQ